MNNKAVKIVFEVMYESRDMTGYVEIPARFFPTKRTLLFHHRMDIIQKDWSIKLKVDCHITTMIIDDTLATVLEYEKSAFLQAFDIYKDIYKNSMSARARIVPSYADEVSVVVKAQDDIDHRWYPLEEIFVIDGDVIPIYE